MGTPHNNGMSQKEMLLLVLEGQDKINERIDSLHEKVNTKMSRQEFSGYFVCYIRSRSFSKSINVIKYPKGVKNNIGHICRWLIIF